jgi:hypothetical protein
MEGSPKLLPEQSFIRNMSMHEIRLRYLEGKLDWDCYIDIERARTHQFGIYEDYKPTVYIEDTCLRGDE